MRKYFGTDGIRRIANTELSPSLVYRVAKAGAYVLSKHSNHMPTILIGRDTRISGTLIESAMVAGFLSYGANVKILGVLPTPGVAYLTKKLKADASVVISASHNTYEFNGVKYFSNKNCNHEILTWHKLNPSPLTNNNYLPDTEYILFFREKGVRLYGSYNTKRKYYLSSTNKKDKEKYSHPTIKPLELIERHIINSSKEGDLVLDCFCGSGTTLVGAINQNRRYIGFEIDKSYYEIARKRIEEAILIKKGDKTEKDTI